MDNNVMYDLSYGLFVLTTKSDGKDNGCIINTVIQVTGNPNKITAVVNKDNYTHDMLLKSKSFNVSIISESADFELFKHFGFSSGKDTDKFSDYGSKGLAENGIYYITEGTNSYISANITDAIDLGTHTMFIADVTDAVKLNNDSSMTYNYYHKNVKPSPAKSEAKSESGYVCKICGYIYKGENLPDDFICPICKHGASDFEKL